MDYRINFQLKDKRPLWVDVVFYIVVSLFIVVLFSYSVLFIKNYQQQQEINTLSKTLSSIGTPEQKQEETEVLNYHKKMADFTVLLQGHTFASNALAFVQENTVPNVLFQQFAMDQQSSQIQLSGEADTLASFSKQVANFENSSYVESVGVISSSVTNSNKVDFSFNLAMDPTIFNYTAKTALQTATVAPVQTAAVGSAANAGVAAPSPAKPSSDKSIVSFSLLLNPNVVGTINEANHTVTLTVPYGTDITSLKPAIAISPKATLSPSSTLPLNFTNPIVYTVTAEDGSQQTYQALVIVAAQPSSGPTQASQPLQSAQPVKSTSATQPVQPVTPTPTVQPAQTIPVSPPVQQPAAPASKPSFALPFNIALTIPTIVFISTLVLLVIIILFSLIEHLFKRKKQKPVA